MEREARLERFTARISRTGIQIRSGGFAQVCGVQLTVVVETFGVTDLNQRAARRADLDANASDDVLAEVVDEAPQAEFPGAATGIRLRLDAIDHADRRTRSPIQRDLVS